MSTGTPTLRDLLELIDEDAFALEADDPFTIAECLGRSRSGPTIWSVITGLGLPTECPLDVADDSHDLSILLESIAAGES
jgi:hypothetical protein